MNLESYLNEKIVTPQAEPQNPEAGQQGEPTQAEPTQGAPQQEPGNPATAGEPAGEPSAEPSFDINSFNAFFGTPYQKEDELKDVLKRANEYGDIQQKLTAAEESIKALENKNKELEESLDPLKYFSSPDAYVAEQIKKQMGDVDPAVVTRLLSHEKNKMANFDLLVYDWLMQFPDTIGGAEGARKVLAKRYDVDLEEPAEEWDAVAQNMIMADARIVEKKIAQMKGQIKLPEPLSAEAVAARRADAAEKTKLAWTPYLGEITGFDKLVVPGDDGTTLLEMEVPKAFRDILPEHIQEIVQQAGLEPTPESIKEVINHRNRKFVFEYLPQILKVYGNNIRSEIEASNAALLNNTVPPNTAAAPAPAEPKPGDGAKQLLSSTRRSNLYSV